MTCQNIIEYTGWQPMMPPAEGWSRYNCCCGVSVSQGVVRASVVRASVRPISDRLVQAFVVTGWEEVR